MCTQQFIQPVHHFKHASLTAAFSYLSSNQLLFHGTDNTLTEVQSMLEQTRNLLANQEKKKKKKRFGRYVIGFGIGLALGIIVTPIYAN
jgi:hypothetical protein